MPSKDVETAKYLLARVPFADIPDFLDYALAEAKKTRFDVQTLGGLKQYLSRYQERGTLARRGKGNPGTARGRGQGHAAAHGLRPLPARSN